MVVVALLGIILPVITALLLSVQKNEASIQSRSEAGNEATVMGESLSKLIHSAATPTTSQAAIAMGSADELVLFTDLGDSNGPTEVDIRVCPVGDTSYQACTTATPAADATYDLMEFFTYPTSGPTYAQGAPSGEASLGSGIVPTTPSTTADCPSGSGTFTPGIFEYQDASGSCLPLSSSPAQLTSTQMADVDSIVVNLTTVDPQRSTVSPSSTYTLHVYLQNVEYQNQAPLSSTTTVAPTTTTTPSTTTSTSTTTTTTVKNTTTTCSYYYCGGGGGHGGGNFW